MIGFTVVASEQEGWHDIWATKEGEENAKIGVLKTENDGSILGGITLPTVNSSFVRSSNETPATMPPNHIQIFP